MSSTFSSHPPLNDVIEEMRQTLESLKPRTNLPTNNVMTTHSAKAKELYRARRRRQHFIPEIGDLLQEPVWDILLDLFIAGQNGSYISVSDACIGSGAAASTALRVLGILEDRGLIFSERDQFDKRRRYVKLSPAANQQMANYLTEI